MTDVLEDVLASLLEAYQKGANVVLLFDYDGTLVPIQAHPCLATLPLETRRLLERLAEQPRLSLGILSGRAIEELIQIVGLPNLYYCGTSGLEINLRGRRIGPSHPEGLQVLIERLARTLQPVAAAVPGAWVEKKPLGLTVHYRGIAADQVPAFKQNVEHALQPFAGQLRVLPGPRAVEITPDLGWTKGSAVRRIVQDVGQDAVPLYAGDGANDDDALAAVQALGGVALAIGPEALASARNRLADPASLACFLQCFLEKLPSLS